MNVFLFRHNRLFFLGLMMALPAWSQTTPQAGQVQSAQEQPGQEQSEPQSNPSDAVPAASDIAPVPLPVSNGANALTFSSEQARTNYLRGGLTLGSSYDDNALNSGSNRVDNFTYSVLPHIVWDQSTSRLRWTLDYAAGLMVNQRFSERNQASHDLGMDLRYRLTPHVNVGIRDNFSLTSGFFDEVQNFAGTPAGGVLQQPNGSVITPLARRTADLGMADITYQFGAGSVVGASGTFYTSRYGQPASGAASLVDTTSEQADGFYTYRISPRNWIGVDYRFQQISFAPGSDQVVTHSLLLFHTIYLQPRMSFSIFAGPEYSEFDSTAATAGPVLISSDRWSVAGGASYSWQGENTSVQINAVRRVSDGGGLLEAVQLNSVNGALRRQLTRRSNLEFGAAYGKSDSIGNVSTAIDSIQVASGSVSWERRLGANLGLKLGYARDYQLQDPGVSVSSEANHNRGWVTVSYDFSRPLGR